MGEFSFRTDLAAEARDLWRRGRSADLPGLFTCREDRQGFAADVVEIETEAAANELCKPKGRYVTLELGALLRREEDAFARACAVLSEELRTQLRFSGGESVLVVGLGNPDVTPDAVGPLAAEQVLVTRHLKERLPADFAPFRTVSVFRSGVLGTTGVESAELTAAVTDRIRPDRVVSIDALAAADPGWLCRSVQITDAGVVPGSGVGNARAALNRDTLGVPVVSVGVPTVVDARAFCRSAAPEGDPLFVTPRDIDARVRQTARLVGRAVDLALHPGLRLEDVEQFLS